MTEAEEDKTKKHNLRSLFRIYSNLSIYPLDLDNVVHDSILLSQIDIWLDQAKLLRTMFPTTETGLLYMKFKKWRLDYEDFLEFLQALCVGKTIKPDQLGEKLVEAGPPRAQIDIIIVK